MSPDAVAAIDCGTNSLRLLVADPGPDGALVERIRRTEIVRLGQGVDATGVFADEALERTFAVLDDYAAALTDAGVGPERRRMVATSAARDAGNRDVFLAGVRRRVGVVPEIISGEREAQLSFVGALSSPAVRAALGGDQVLVVDIGGGSTELVLGTRDGRIAAAESLPMGSVRLTERFLTTDLPRTEEARTEQPGTKPPSAEQLREATAYVDGLLDASAVDLTGVRDLVGVAGTVVTLAWLTGTITADPRQAPGRLVRRQDLADVAARLAARSAEQIRAIPGMHPGRADVIAAGALIADRIAARARHAAGLVVSIADILDGLALEIVDASGTARSSGPGPVGNDRIGR